MNKTVLITGSTSGIGLEFSRLFAQKKYNLILISRNINKLKKLQDELISKNNISIDIIKCDFTDINSSNYIYQEIKQKNLNVDVLINNAGIGSFGYFNDNDLNIEIDIIKVNIIFLTKLSKLILPDMLENNSGKILNVSSIAAFVPGPLMTVYYASKAFVLSFSSALANELSGTGITVTTLCPSITKTGFQEKVGMKSIKRKMSDPKDVALFGYKALMKEKNIAIYGNRNRILIFLIKFFPINLITKIIRKRK